MQLEILSRSTIKPSSQTPSHLNIHTLSLFDQFAPNNYIPLVFFYHCNNGGGFTTSPEKSDSLRKSLSKTLSRYYPFAGRIRDEVSVDCNDEGVPFVEARLKFLNLSQILKNPRNEILDLLFVNGLQWKDPKSGSLLAVQVTFFDCGGFAIGVLLSHRFADMATVVTFVNDWALITRQKDNIAEELEINPDFTSSTLFPQGDIPAMKGAVMEEESSVICKRFVFERSKIETLKNSISEKLQIIPTRVETVSALLYKSAIKASGSNHPTILLQTVNLRSRVIPPAPENLVGSLVSAFPVTGGGREVELHELVGEMREKMAEYCEKYAEKYRTEEWIGLIKKRLGEMREMLSRNGGNQVITYRVSSGCRFRVYGADFGWGKPEWVAIAGLRLKNAVMMLDTKNGGIEAIVSLEEKEMVAFENNEELLAFASQIY